MEMIDREKVIKGLHCCAHTDGTNCVYCPYDNKEEDCTALMSMDVLDLLKEQPEIVRCKDCAYYVNWGDEKICLQFGSWYGRVPEDFFCANGEKRNEENGW